ncbi:semaphorin-3A isoform X2 [Prionailurus iriomotensis]
MGWFARIVCLFWGVLLTATANYQNGKNNVPRLKLSYKEMLESNNVITFNGLANSSSYHTFLLDEERSRLYVGAKDHIFSFNLVNIKDFQKLLYGQYLLPEGMNANGLEKISCLTFHCSIHNLRTCKEKECANFIKVLKAYNQTHLYACGTGAFHPICTYIEIGHHPEDNIFKLEDSHFENGRGKSPYDPKLLTASLLIAIFKKTYIKGQKTGKLALCPRINIQFDNFINDLETAKEMENYTPGPQLILWDEILRSSELSGTITQSEQSSMIPGGSTYPRFISAHLIPESDNPEDDKVYFFFRENAIDGEHTGKATHARIGQICKNDFGGHRSLVNKWTTFLKARLICSVPGPNGIDTHFDELQDVFLMSSKDPKNPIVYGVFTTSSNIFKGSAVCMYSMSDVRRVFLGPYAHRDGPNYQWVPYQGRVPYPRPGTCPSKTFGGFDSTKDLPDDVITFARSHPAMYNPVFPINNRPIMIKTDVNYQFTQIVVDRVDAEDGQYDVMFIGTDVGTVLKVVSIPKETWHDLEEVLLEEMTVFREPTTISAMELSTKQINNSILVPPRGLPSSLYTDAIFMGKRARSAALPETLTVPGMALHALAIFPLQRGRTRRQDIRNGDPLTHCSDLQHHDNHHGHSLEERIIYGVENSSTFLECSPKSQRALVYWQFQRRNEERKEEIRVDDHIIRTEQGLLLRSLQRKDSGNYLCHAVEHGFMQTLLKVTLEVIDTEHLEELLHKDDDADGSKTKEMSNSMTPSQKVWYRDFMQLINHPNLNTMDEFCEQVWKRDRKQRRQRPGHAQGNNNKWKHLQENKKGRNRRTHEFERAPRSV